MLLAKKVNWVIRAFCLAHSDKGRNGIFCQTAGVTCCCELVGGGGKWSVAGLMAWNNAVPEAAWFQGVTPNIEQSTGRKPPWRIIGVMS